MGMEDRNWYVGDDERRGAGFGAPQVRFSFGPKTPPVTKWLIIIIIAAYLLQLLVDSISSPAGFFTKTFAFKPAAAVGGLQVWRFVTYIFLHADPFHLLINMFIFWMFAREVELHLGRWKYLAFFLSCGVAGAAVSCFFPGWYYVRTIGASAAVLGVLTLWGLLWPNRIILLMFIFPVKAKWLVIGMAVIDLLYAVQPGGNSNVAYLAHLGGMAAGALFVLIAPRLDSLLVRRKARAGFRKAEVNMDVDRRVDELLDKIRSHGMNSLTGAEKKFLKNASKRYKK